MKQLIFAFLFVIALSACSEKIPEAAQNAEQIETTAKVGEKFSISLPSNVTTGYSWWILKMDNKKLETLEKRNEGSTDPNLIGAGGNDVFVFNAKKAAETTIYFQYKRENETEVKKYKRVLVKINE